MANRPCLLYVERESPRSSGRMTVDILKAQNVILRSYMPPTHWAAIGMPPATGSEHGWTLIYALCINLRCFYHESCLYFVHLFDLFWNLVAPFKNRRVSKDMFDANKHGCCTCVIAQNLWDVWMTFKSAQVRRYWGPIYSEAVDFWRQISNLRRIWDASRDVDCRR
jgi:hypothetical protein